MRHWDKLQKDGDYWCGAFETVEAFNRLPEEFTTEDVMRCFGCRDANAASVRVARLVKDHLVEKMDSFVENGTTKALYRKTALML